MKKNYVDNIGFDHAIEDIGMLSFFPINLIAVSRLLLVGYASKFMFEVNSGSVCSCVDKILHINTEQRALLCCVFIQ